MISKKMWRSTRALVDRFDLLSIKSKKVGLEEWDVLESRVKSTVPDWYRMLLAEFPLVGPALETRDLNENTVRQFLFLAPQDFSVLYTPKSLTWTIFDHGYFVIAGEADGNLWLIYRNGESDPQLFLFELSDWNGAKPSIGNGLTQMAKRLSAFLTLSGISRDYYEDG